MTYEEGLSFVTINNAEKNDDGHADESKHGDDDPAVLVASSDYITQENRTRMVVGDRRNENPLDDLRRIGRRRRAGLDALFLPRVAVLWCLGRQ